MKKLITTLIAVVLTTTFGFAQKGTFALGVGSTIDNEMWIEYSLTPTVGYFITDNMMVGTGLSYISSSEDGVMTPGWMAEGDIESSNFNISPFFRYYIIDGMYASAGVSIGSSTYSEDASAASGYTLTGENSTSTFGLNLGVGYSLMWNDRICFEPSFGISTSSGSATNKSNVGGIVTESSTDAPSVLALSIGLGVHIRIGKK